jgi:hypothetical protein
MNGRALRTRAAGLASTALFAAFASGAWREADAQLPERTEHRLVVGGGTIDVTVIGAPASESALIDWIDDSARGVAAYLGRFPVPQVRLAVRIGTGRGIAHGVTYGGRLPSIRIQAGSGADARAFASDWVLTHEMLHLGFPDLTSDDSWAEEGLSTYAEPLARLRAGTMRPDKVWVDLIEGLPKGQPGPGDGGLHGTEEWGRTYWGGAGFWLTADVRIREQTGTRKGLPDALAGILAAGGDIRAHWTLAHALEAGDRALGLTVLSDLYREQGARPGSADLDALWKRLGISRAGGRIVYDDRAPLASVRNAIVAPAADRSVSADR